MAKLTYKQIKKGMTFRVKMIGSPDTRLFRVTGKQAHHPAKLVFMDAPAALNKEEPWARMINTPFTMSQLNQLLLLPENPGGWFVKEVS